MISKLGRPDESPASILSGSVDDLTWSDRRLMGIEDAAHDGESLAVAVLSSSIHVQFAVSRARALLGR